MTEVVVSVKEHADEIDVATRTSFPLQLMHLMRKVRRFWQKRQCDWWGYATQVFALDAAEAKGLTQLERPQ